MDVDLVFFMFNFLSAFFRVQPAAIERTNLMHVLFV